jgi:hypothetical protein
MVMPSFVHHKSKIAKLLIGAFLILLASCSPAYNLTDRSGNVFVIEKPELETKGSWEYRAGDAIRELSINEVVFLSVLDAEPRVFDGKIFYPATLKLEDSVSVPAQGFICVEGMLRAESVGKKFSIQLANIKEFSLRQEEEQKEEEQKEENPNDAESKENEPVEEAGN